MNQPDTPAMSITIRQPRLWPISIIIVLVIAAFIVSVTPSIQNGLRFQFMFLGPIAGGAFFVLWLMLGSRIAWWERFVYLLAPVLIAGGVLSIVHASAKFAMMTYGIPLTMMTVAIGLHLGRNASKPRNRVLPITAALLGVWLLFPTVRLDGYDGAYLPEFTWRWSTTHEQALAKMDSSVNTTPSAWTAAAEEWPQFRGSQQNSRVSLADTPAFDWNASPPRVNWNMPIGPGWSSFIHVSGRLFTQEQRGDDEWVSCYDAATGDLVWKHADASRFTEVVSGAGPGATPTYHNGRIYSYGARAILNCLDAATGAVVWTHDLVDEVEASIPMWGFSGSPVVTNGVVIVYADGRDKNGLMAFDVDSGEVVWTRAWKGWNYSTPQLVNIEGEALMLFGDKSTLHAMNPSTAETVWEYTSEEWNGFAMCQPQQIGANSLIVPLGDGIGVARIEVRKASGEWQVTEAWFSRRLKPSFNDFVYHEGHLYGFDQSIFTSINAETGERNWKRGRYGFGQVILLEDQAQLVVLAESGETILLAADPSVHMELGRLQPITGKTWNHPIVADGQLFVRNAEQAACLTLVMSEQTDTVADSIQ